MNVSWAAIGKEGGEDERVERKRKRAQRSLSEQKCLHRAGSRVGKYKASVIQFKSRKPLRWGFFGKNYRDDEASVLGILLRQCRVRVSSQAALLTEDDRKDCACHES